MIAFKTFQGKWLLVVLLALALSASARGSIKIRLDGGFPIPTTEFKQKTYSLAIGGVTAQMLFETASKYAFGIGAGTSLGRLPFDLFLSSGIMYFDDQHWEMEETTYLAPLGNGHRTDFQHRIIPLTLQLEYVVAGTDRTSTSIGLGAGVYFYNYVNRGDYQPELTGMEGQSHFGWNLGFVQYARISRTFGAFFNMDYHWINLGSGDSLGLFPPGAIKHITFYRILLGIELDLLN